MIVDRRARPDETSPGIVHVAVTARRVATATIVEGHLGEMASEGWIYRRTATGFVLEAPGYFERSINAAIDAALSDFDVDF
jgi:hypothetical protein